MLKTAFLNIMEKIKGEYQWVSFQDQGAEGIIPIAITEAITIRDTILEMASSGK